LYVEIHKNALELYIVNFTDIIFFHAFDTNIEIKIVPMIIFKEYAPKKIFKQAYYLILLIFIISFWSGLYSHVSATEAAAPFIIKKDTISPDSAPPLMRVIRSWVLPEQLRRVSGFDFISKTRVAFVHENTGSIFLFNLATRKLEKEIPFAPPGDYQSIALVGSTAYIISADGRVLQVKNFMSSKRSVTEFGTHLSARNNPTGIAYDKLNRRLIVCVKGIEDAGPSYRGIYSYDLSTQKMGISPVIKISMADSVLNPGNSRKLLQLLQPSDLALKTPGDDLLISDAVKSQLILVSASGEVKKIYGFPREELIQPEGVRVTPSGELYIVSAGFKDEPGKLLLIATPRN
jgi:uncharacterized protein YjiK